AVDGGGGGDRRALRRYSRVAATLKFDERSKINGRAGKRRARIFSAVQRSISSARPNRRGAGSSDSTGAARAPTREPPRTGRNKIRNTDDRGDGASVCASRDGPGDGPEHRSRSIRSRSS